MRRNTQKLLWLLSGGTCLFIFFVLYRSSDSTLHQDDIGQHLNLAGISTEKPPQELVQAVDNIPKRSYDVDFWTDEQRNKRENPMIDWHDWKAIQEDLKRSGPGEQGTAVEMSAADAEKRDELYKVNGFNAYCSDKISLTRSIRDIRHTE